MKEELISILKCSACSSIDRFSLNVYNSNNIEILSGSLICKKCKQEFPIEQGIVNLLYNPSETIRKEREAYKYSKLNLMKQLDYQEKKDAVLESFAHVRHTCKQFQETSKLNVNGIFTQLQLTGKEKVLDLGAGSCMSSTKFAVLGCKCVALDISADLHLDLAVVHMRQKGVYFERILADMGRLPFQEDSFDIVFSTASIHHSESLMKTVQEIARVLKSKGRVAIVNEPMHGVLEFFVHKFFNSIKKQEPGINENTYNFFQWIAAIRRAGLNSRFFFPQYYDEILSGRIKEKTKFYAIRIILSLLWRTPIFKKIILKYFFLLGQVMFGINVVMIAGKNTEKKREFK